MYPQRFPPRRCGTITAYRNYTKAGYSSGNGRVWLLQKEIEYLKIIHPMNQFKGALNKTGSYL